MTENDEARIYDVADGTPWEPNEHGLWCPSCGEIIAAPWNIRADYVAPDECGTCGFPDDAEKMQEYFVGEIDA